MLIVNTCDDWTEAAVILTVGASAQSFIPSAAVDSAYKFAQEITAFFGTAFSVSATFAFLRDSASGGLVLQITAGSSFGYVPTFAAIQLAGIGIYAVPTASVTGAAPVAGGWGPQHYGLGGYHKNPAFSGVASGSGSVGSLVSASAHRRPKLEAVCTATEAAQLVHVQGQAGSPLLCEVFQQSSNAWRRLSLGTITRTRRGPLLYSITATFLG